GGRRAQGAPPRERRPLARPGRPGEAVRRVDRRRGGQQVRSSGAGAAGDPAVARSPGVAHRPGRDRRRGGARRRHARGVVAVTYSRRVANPFGKILLITGNSEFLSDRARRRAIDQVRRAVPEVEVAESTASALAPGEFTAMTDRKSTR